MREPSPDFKKNRVGPKSISTPGNLNAWAEMHDQYGSMPWQDLFDASITHATEGFEIDPFTAWMISIAYGDFSPYSRSFYGKDGEPLKVGELLVQQDLGKTLQEIANNGVRAFYEGQIAEAIDQAMVKSGSFLRIEDLKKNEAEWWEPLKINYRDYEVYTAALPANSKISAHRYSNTAAKYTGAPAPIRVAYFP